MGDCWEKCCITLQEGRVLSSNAKRTGTHSYSCVPNSLHVIHTEVWLKWVVVGFFFVFFITYLPPFNIQDILCTHIKQSGHTDVLLKSWCLAQIWWLHGIEANANGTHSLSSRLTDKQSDHYVIYDIHILLWNMESSCLLQLQHYSTDLSNE